MHVGLFRLYGSPNERADAREPLRKAIVDALASGEDMPAELTIMVGIDEPAELAFTRDVTDHSPPWDVAVCGEWVDDATFLAACARVRASSGSFELSGYRTDWVVKKKSADPLCVGAIPGVRMLHPLFFHEDLPRSAILRSWRELHGSLAIEAHSGASYYGQMLVLETLTVGAQAFGGFSEFQFPSREALIGGYFASPEARRAVRHDIKHFLRGLPPRLFADASQYASVKDGADRQ